MKLFRYLFLSLSLFLLCSSAFAEPVTVSGTSFSGWTYGGATMTLRVYSTKTFVTGSSTTVIGGTTAGFYKTVSCTVASTTVTCPSVNLDTTTDGSPNTARYVVDMYDSGNRLRGRYLDAAQVPVSLGTPVTWEQLRIYNLAPAPVLAPSYYTADQVNVLLAGIGGGGTWGSITGTLSSQTDLNSALNAKQNTLISGTSIKTVNGNSLLGSGDLTLNIPTPVFEGISTTHLGLWGLDRLRSAYSGPAVRVGLAADSGATTLDIGFTSDGSFDWAAYAAFGTGSERVVRVYDQSGNGQHLDRSWSATLCPIIRISDYNSKPAIYFNGTGSIGNAAFTDWNGLANVNLIFARRQVTTIGASRVYSGGSGQHELYSTATQTYLFENGFSSYKRVDNAFVRNAGLLQRQRFKGGETVASNRLSLWQNRKVYNIPGAEVTAGATWTNETGLYLNGAANGTTECLDSEYFAFAYIGQDVDASWDTIRQRLETHYFSFTSSQVIGSGDSLTVSYNTNVTDSEFTYPKQFERQIEAATGRTWNLIPATTFAEVGATLSRIYQLAALNTGGAVQVDDWRKDRVVLAWAGTNDLSYASTLPAKTFTADSTTDILTSTSHGFAYGLLVRVTNSGGALPGGLSASVDYYVNPTSANTFQLATSIANLVAGVYVDMSSNGTGTQTATPTPSGSAAIANAKVLAQKWIDLGASRVYYLNMLPRTDLGGGNAAFETQRQTFNSGLAAGLPSGVQVIPVTDIPQLADSTNTTYYIDGVHLSELGYALVAEKVRDFVYSDIRD